MRKIESNKKTKFLGNSLSNQSLNEISQIKYFVIKFEQN